MDTGQAAWGPAKAAPHAHPIRSSGRQARGLERKHVPSLLLAAIAAVLGTAALHDVPVLLISGLVLTVIEAGLAGAALRTNPSESREYGSHKYPPVISPPSTRGTRARQCGRPPPTVGHRPERRFRQPRSERRLALCIDAHR